MKHYTVTVYKNCQRVCKRYVGTENLIKIIILGGKIIGYTTSVHMCIR